MKWRNWQKPSGLCSHNSKLSEANHTLPLLGFKFAYDRIMKHLTLLLMSALLWSCSADKPQQVTLSSSSNLSSSSTLAPAFLTGSMTLDFTRSSTQGDFSPYNIYAAWWSDAQGKWLANIDVHAAFRSPNLVQWYAQYGQLPEVGIDAVTGATDDALMPVHAIYTFAQLGFPTGDYQLHIEFTESNSADMGGVAGPSALILLTLDNQKLDTTISSISHFPSIRIQIDPLANSNLYSSIAQQSSSSFTSSSSTTNLSSSALSSANNGSSSAVLSSSSTPQLPTIHVDVTPVSNNLNKHYPKNIYAIWLSDLQGNWVTNLDVRAGYEAVHLIHWAQAYYGHALPLNRDSNRVIPTLGVDGVTGATRLSFDAWHIAWQGNLAAGDYILHLENTTTNSGFGISTMPPGPYNSIPLHLGNSALDTTINLDSYYPDLRVRYAP